MVQVVPVVQVVVVRRVGVGIGIVQLVPVVPVVGVGGVGWVVLIVAIRTYGQKKRITQPEPHDPILRGVGVRGVAPERPNVAHIQPPVH